MEDGGKMGIKHVEELSPETESNRDTEPEIERDNAAIQKSLNRKSDFRIIPVLFMVYFCSWMDRASIGNAAIAGITTDLKLRGTSYNVALALFFVIYALSNFPAAWLFAKLGRGRFIAGSIFCWGWVTFSIGFITDKTQLYILRCLLGLFEGGLTTCLFVYLSLFYTRFELQGRAAWFYISGPLSNAVGGLLASGLDRISVGRYREWRWIFIVEGAFTVLIGIFCVIRLPSWPSKAKWLTPEEKTAAERRTAEINNTHGSDGEEERPLTFRRVMQGLLDWNTILNSVAAIGIDSNIYAYTTFSPTIIHSFGFNVLDSQLLSAPPYVVASIYILISSHIADRVRLRGPIIVVGMVISAIGWILQLTCTTTGPRYFGLFLIVSGSMGCVTANNSWVLNNVQPQLSRTVGQAAVVAVGQMGGVAATFTYIADKTAKAGNAMQIGFAGLAIVCAVALMLYNKRENAKRERGERDYRLTDGKIPVDELGSRHPSFRLTL